MASKQNSRQRSLFFALKPGPNPPKEIFVVVENPKGAFGKFEMDKETGAIFLDRTNYAPCPFPFEYGFIPQTWNPDDNDPQDALVISRYPTFPGCVIPARVVGLLKMIDTGERDDKIVAVPLDDPYYQKVKDWSDLKEFERSDIEFFWQTYKLPMPKRYVKVQGWRSKKEGWRLVNQAITEFKKKFG